MAEIQRGYRSGNLEQLTRRKIIQISCAGVVNTTSTQGIHITTALCSDGSVWEMRDNTAIPQWVRLPEIPQTK